MAVTRAYRTHAAESSESREENYNSNGEESSGSQDSGKRVFASHFRSGGGAT